jgi:ferredoxin
MHRCWIRPSDDAAIAGTWFDVTAGQRVLHEMIKRNVADIPVGCRGGGCGACRIRVVEGEYTTRRMSRRHVSEHDEANGIVLACRLIPSSDIVVELAPAASEPTWSKAHQPTPDPDPTNHSDNKE